MTPDQELRAAARHLEDHPGERWHPSLAAVFRAEADAWERAAKDSAPVDLPRGTALAVAREVLAGSLPVLREEDLRIDVYRDGAPWHSSALPGFHGCAVRVTHLPTGLVVTKENRSGLQAKAEALEELRSKVRAATVHGQAM